MAGKNPVFSFNFDEDETKFQDDAARGPAPMPVGWYHVAITDVKLETYQANSVYGQGKKPKQRLVLTAKVVSGEFAGREIRYVTIPLFPRWNPGPKTPNGSATSFYSFFGAAGLLSEEGAVVVSDWNELFGIELMAKVVPDKKDDGRVFNQIQTFGGTWRAITDEDLAGGSEDDVEFGEPSEESVF